MSEKPVMDGMRLTVLGAGTSGISLAFMAHRLGADVFVSDSAKISGPALARLEEAGIPYEQGGHTENVFSGDIIVVGSGFPPKAPIIAKLRERGASPVGELDFALPFISSRVIGVTGSNGKTTTTSLLAHLIRALGAKCRAAGNIGSAIADFAGADLDYIVLELSSFQLYWTKSANLAGAIVTNLAPDHIDWHGSYENYAASKARILSFVRDEGFSVIQERDRETLGYCGGINYSLSWGGAHETQVISLSTKEKNAMMGGVELFRFCETNLIGVHNMENTAMAMAAVKLLGLDAESARASLASYEAPPHRCRLVLTTNSGVRYIDDSKGTNIAASSAAMSSIEGPHIVILGGRGKNEDYAGLLEPLRKFAKCAVLIGEESDNIAAALESGGYMNFLKTGDMESAVKIASGLACPGDSVLLSPACTSWDAYKNYEERGEHFTSLVMKYAGDKNDAVRR
ncbi:MAG: UDP-N-acetylmuramoyl-L-alanine--D-glutamate ligase [Synergistaceae bacterium]|jgi:UDP-N-acetylmuramoylalanine--D-glutamate ligase|nr:UDP-N-acetylmuramoyl-L-alanine--D-glutamate ligase [Synergistaceae bacterium]